jgi:hypothetical protein
VGHSSTIAQTDHSLDLDPDLHSQHHELDSRIQSRLSRNSSICYVKNRPGSNALSHPAPFNRFSQSAGESKLPKGLRTMRFMRCGQARRQLDTRIDDSPARFDCASACITSSARYVNL